MMFGAKRSGTTQRETCAVASTDFTQWFVLAGWSNTDRTIHGSVPNKIMIK